MHVAVVDMGEVGGAYFVALVNTWGIEKLRNTTFIYSPRWSQKLGPGIPRGIPWGGTHGIP